MKGAIAMIAVALAGFNVTAQTVAPPPAPPGLVPRPVSGPRPAIPGLLRPPATPSTNAADEPPRQVPSFERNKPAETNKTVALKFNAAPLEQVLQFYGDLTGRTLLSAPNVNAVVTLRSQDDLTIPEAMQAIRTVLSMNNIGLLEIGTKFVKVVPIATVQQEGLPIQSNVWQELRHPEDEQVISEIVPLKYIDPAEAQKAVTGLLHGYGKILVLERINSLLIADTTININRIKDIIAQVDQPLDIKEKMRIIPIHSAKASDIKTKLEEIIAEQKDQEGKTTIRRPATTGSPGVETSPAVPTIPGIIRARMPAPVPNTGGTVQPAAEVPADEGKMIRGTVRIIADDRTGILIIITRPENMPFLESVVTALDVPTAPDVMVKVVRLEYAEADEVATMLNALIGAASAPRKDATPKATTTTPTTTPGTYGPPGALAPTTPQPAKSSPLQDFLEQQRANAVAPHEGKTKIGQLSAENIKILPDKRTNALIIMASKNDMEALMEVIKGMDIMLSQVLIEAVILSVNLDNKMQSGVDWVQRSLVAYNQQANGTRNPVFAFAGGGGGGTLTPKDATALSSTFAAGQGLTYYFTHFGLNLDAVVQWASSDSRTRVLASPVILTTDNKEAKIDVSSQQYVYKGISYQAVSGAANYQAVPNVDLQKVGLNLTVTPHINQKKFVVMQIDQKIDEFGAPQAIEGQGSWPTINSREMSASIAVRSGETIILGGLIKNTKTQSRAKIPVLGDIPLLGIPFRSSNKDDAREEVVVFITPRVLDSPEEIEDESRRRKEATSMQGMWEKGWSNSHLAEPKTSRFGQWWRNLLK